MEIAPKVRRKITEDAAEVSGPRSAYEVQEVGTAHGATELPPIVELLAGARTTEAIFAVDPDHRIVHWNSRMESLTGVLSEEAVGKPFYEALAGECEDGVPFAAHAWSTVHLVEDGQPIPGYDARIATRTGGERWVGVSVVSVTSREGTYLVHLVRDTQKTHDTIEMARGVIRLSSKDGAATDARPNRRSGAPELTPRQREVLGMLAEGKGVKEIQRELYLSQATVRNHVRSLLQALGAHSQLEALAKARKAGLLEG